MFVLDKNIFKFFIALVVLVILTGSICIYSNANTGAVIVEKKISGAENSLIDDDYLVERKHAKTKPQHKKYNSNEMLQLSDSYFLHDEQPTFKDLLLKVLSIILFLFGILLIVRLTSNSKTGTLAGFSRQLSLMIKNRLLPSSGIDSLKLIQSLTLAPGQCIYLVETNDKKILLGSAPQSGINYLVDLSCEELKDLDFKQIELLQECSKKQTNSDTLPIFVTEDKSAEINENHEKLLNKASFDLIHSTKGKSTKKNEPAKVDYQSPPFKRRIKFSQTLLTSHK